MDSTVTLNTLLELQVMAQPEKVFLKWSEGEITYGQVDEQTGRMARVFRELGLTKGDKVCVMLPNVPEYFYAWFALSRLGAVMVPVNVHLRGAGLAYIIDHSDSRIVIGDQRYAPQLAEVMCRTVQVEHWIWRAPALPEGVQGHLLADLLIRTPPDTAPAADVRPEDVISILYTSGTTGVSKGAVISHAAYVAQGELFADRMLPDVSREDVFYTCLPMFHINAQILTTMGVLHKGATMAMGERFSVTSFWSEIRRYNASYFNALGAMMVLLHNAPAQANDADNPARIVFSAACPKELWPSLEKRFGIKLIEGYGMTETGGVTHCNPIGRVKLGSMGLPYTDLYETRVVDEDDRPVSPGIAGELIIRERKPHLLLKAYYKQPEKTADAMRGGWFHTGDRVRMDEDGYYYFIDRLKDCIRRRGENISSFEVERAVVSHPKVQQVAAVGVPSELGEEDVKIYVVLKPGEDVAPEDLLDWCSGQLAYFAMPRYVEFLDELPRTATERTQKFELRKLGIGGAWDRERAGYQVKR